MGGIAQVWADDAKAQVDEGDAVIVDVRTPRERDQERISGSVHIPLRQLQQRWDEIPDAATVIFQCHSGQRSQRAAMWAADRLDAGVANLSGGIEAWERAGLPVDRDDG